jgi:hypothetical protein
MPSDSWLAPGVEEGGRCGREVSLIAPLPQGISADLLYTELYYMKVLELLRPAMLSNIANRIDASTPIQMQLASTLSVSFTPMLYKAQEAKKEHWKEDLAVEESVKEVLA